LNRQNLLVLVRVGVSLQLIHIVSISFVGRLNVARSATLEVVALLALSEVLENPVLLDLLVGRELLLQKDEGMHLLVQHFAPLVPFSLPEVLAFQLKGLCGIGSSSLEFV
jgi:hypothetical protein